MRKKMKRRNAIEEKKVRLAVKMQGKIKYHLRVVFSLTRTFETASDSFIKN